MSATQTSKRKRKRKVKVKLWLRFECDQCGYEYESPIPAYSPMMHRCPSKHGAYVLVKGTLPAN